jgi:hypothetical protein
MPTLTKIVPVLALLLSAAAIVPARAFACTCSVQVFVDAEPKNHAGGVALDIAPFIQGAFDASTIELMDEHGGDVEFTLQEGPRTGCLGAWAELKPKAQLQPNTRYTISAEPLYPDSFPPGDRTQSLTFTTGAEPLAQQHLEPPEHSHVSVVTAAIDCGGLPTTMMCIGGLDAPSPTDLELIVRHEDEVLLRVTGDIIDDGMYVLPEVPTCVELRRRAANGQRSEPVTICGDALGVRAARPSDYERGAPVCHDGRFGSGAGDDGADAGTSDAGVVSAEAGASPLSAADAPRKLRGEVSACSIGAGRESAADAAVLLLVLGALLRRRPARRRQSG